jgi:hypothetical protein
VTGLPGRQGGHIVDRGCGLSLFSFSRLSSLVARKKQICYSFDSGSSYLITVNDAMINLPGQQ